MESKLFSDPDFLREINTGKEIKHFVAGSVILNIDAYINFIPLVLSGSIKVIRTDDENKEILLYYLTPGESCISSILAGFTQGTSKVKVIVEEDADILMISLKDAKQWLRKYPEWTDFIFSLYQRRFEDLLEVVNAVAFQKVDARILHLLNQKAQLYKSKELAVTHQQIADELGISREAASRVLKQIESNGTIKLSRNKITLL